jgi:hypothetical protein
MPASLPSTSLETWFIIAAEKVARTGQPVAETVTPLNHSGELHSLFFDSYEYICWLICHRAGSVTFTVVVAYIVSVIFISLEDRVTGRLITLMFSVLSKTVLSCGESEGEMYSRDSGIMALIWLLPCSMCDGLVSMLFLLASRQIGCFYLALCWLASLTYCLSFCTSCIHDYYLKRH